MEIVVHRGHVAGKEHVERAHRERGGKGPAVVAREPVDADGADEPEYRLDGEQRDGRVQARAERREENEHWLEMVREECLVALE